MKRSEMVKIINKKLLDSTEGYSNCNLTSFMEVADVLLDELEHRGMLPPKLKYKPGKHSNPRKIWINDSTFTWEPEDEA